MVVTPLRDGMNLVAKEYVAARIDHGGALVLSEFAGAASELRQAFLCNPHDLDGIKDALLRAIRRRRGRGGAGGCRSMRRYLRVARRRPLGADRSSTALAAPDAGGVSAGRSAARRT